MSKTSVATNRHPNRRQWWILGIASLLVVALLPAIASASNNRAATRPRTSGADTISTRLRLAMPDTSTTVDPALVADEENVQLANLLYSGLVRLDATYHVVAGAASHWKISQNRRVYTFYLRPGLEFSNGQAVTAEDFRYSIQRSLNPTLSSPSAPTYLLDIQGASEYLGGSAKTVSGIKVINATTLQLTARWPVPYFLIELTYPTSFVLDQKAIAKQGPIDNTSWYANPIGSGPYRLKSWIPNTSIVLVRNPHYAGKQPAVKVVDISLSPLASHGVDLFRYVKNHLDVVSLPSYDSSVVHKPGIREAKMLSTADIYMRFKSKPLGNVHVRRALALALNRALLVRQGMHAIVTPFGGYVPPGEMGYDPGLRPLPYNVVQARRELALGGYPTASKFPHFTLDYGADPSNPAVAKLVTRFVTDIAKRWHAVLGIDVSTRALTLNTLYAKAQSNSLPMYISGWTADYPDPHDWLTSQWRTGAPNNNVKYSNPQFDKLVEAADVTWRPRLRASLYDRAQQILVNDVAAIPLYIPHRLVYIRNSVNNLLLTGYGLIPRAGSWARVNLSATPAHRRPTK